jgi:hypothetical protein
MFKISGDHADQKGHRSSKTRSWPLLIACALLITARSETGSRRSGASCRSSSTTQPAPTGAGGKHVPCACTAGAGRLCANVPGPTSSRAEHHDHSERLTPTRRGSHAPTHSTDYSQTREPPLEKGERRGTLAALRRGQMPDRCEAPHTDLPPLSPRRLRWSQTRAKALAHAHQTFQRCHHERSEPPHTCVRSASHRDWPGTQNES